MRSTGIGRRKVVAALGGGVTGLTGCTDRDPGIDDSDDPDIDDSDNPDIDGTEYESITIFRNDDPAPWTELEPFRNVNNVFIEKEVPLTQGIVPYDGDEDVPLSPEHEVGQYINDVLDRHEDLFGAALHGHTHLQQTDFHGESEFGGQPYDDQQRKITHAIQLFEECTGTTPEIFIPPFNTYDERTVRVLIENGFKLVSGSSYFQREYFERDGFWNDDQLIHLPTNLSLEDWETEAVREIDALTGEYDRNREEYNLNVVMLHYYFYSDEAALRTLEEFVQYTVENENRFMTLNEFATLVERGEMARTESGWIVKE